MKTYLLRVSIQDQLAIQREIELPGSTSLYRLAENIVTAYGFAFDHALGFFSRVDGVYFDSPKKYELFTDLESEGMEPTGAGSVKRTAIRTVWKAIGDTMLFLFDYGDNRQFVVKLTGFGTEKAGVKYPRIIAKIGIAPKQYK